MRRLGWIAALVGTVATICGVAGDFLPLVVIGLVLAAAGGWNIARPTVHGLLVDGVAMILTGVFSGTAALWMEGARGTAVSKGIVGGLFQVAWGVRRLLGYPAARRAPNDVHAIARLEAIVRDLAKRPVSTDESIVEFRNGRFHHQRNRLGLYAEGVVGLLEQQVVRLEKRTDIWIEAKGSTWLGRATRVTVQMGDVQLAGEMPNAHLERFEHWKLGTAPARSIAA